jgi:DNA-binding MarR family transcriptional regulator
VAKTTPAAPPAEWPDNPLALQEQACFALAVASRSVIALYRPVLEPMGLTHPQYLVMLALWEHAPVSVRDLAGMLQLDPATLSPLLKRLESSGYVRRRRNPDDERALAVELTSAGRALRRRALKVPPAIVERLGMDLAELKDLQRSLTRVIEAATRPVD